MFTGPCQACTVLANCFLAKCEEGEEDEGREWDDVPSRVVVIEYHVGKEDGGVCVDPREVPVYISEVRPRPEAEGCKPERQRGRDHSDNNLSESHCHEAEVARSRKATVRVLEETSEGDTVPEEIHQGQSYETSESRRQSSKEYAIAYQSR